jgi:hypothetical protein
MSHIRGLTWMLAVTLALALPASASAGQPFVLDPDGENPHVAIGEDGTGHFVWEDSDVAAIRLKLTRSERRELARLLERGRRARATVAVAPAGAGGKGAERVRVRVKR